MLAVFLTVVTILIALIVLYGVGYVTEKLFMDFPPLPLDEIDIQDILLRIFFGLVTFAVLFCLFLVVYGTYLGVNHLISQ